MDQGINGSINKDPSKDNLFLISTNNIFMNQVTHIKTLLMEYLQIDELETNVFLALMKLEKTTSRGFQENTNLEPDQIIEISKCLEKKGMVIEINKNEFRALHPRFAIVNRYRRICLENNILFKKNTKVDSLGIMLENYQNQT
ncbi:MAG: helix-turn-helix domain-containing protein [Candidatus Nitrosocosmicus sp.]|nr:helix-turn-helix domain-containing protein [Candidatus Nitrosocosmicus sp.]